MDIELRKKFLDAFNKGELLEVKDLFMEENDNYEYNLYKGIIYLNSQNYYLSSKYLFKSFESNPEYPYISGNFIHLPQLYQRKRFIINIEGHLHTTHSFGIIFNNFIKSLLKIENVDLRIKHNDFIGVEDKDYQNIKQVDKNESVDLTIRLCIPMFQNEKSIFNIKKCPKSKITLIFIVTEYIDIRYLDYIENDVLFMTPSNHSKQCFLDGYPEKSNLLDNIIDIIPHGIDYSNHYIFDNLEINHLKLNKFSFTEKDYVFLHVSGNNIAKNVLNIIESFLKIEKENKKLILKINSFKNKYEASEVTQEYKEKYKIYSDIIFLEGNYSIQEMNELYNICDCYISASLCEGFNMPVLEAGSYGKLVIFPENSPPEEFSYAKGVIKIKSKTYVNKGLFIENEDIISSMTKAMITPIDNNLKNEIIVHHLQYNWDKIVNNIVDKYCHSYYKLEMIMKMLNTEKETELDNYYNQLENKNIDEILYYFFRSYNLNLTDLYFYIYSKNKRNILKSFLKKYFITDTNMITNLHKSTNLNYLFQIIPFMTRNKEEYEFICDIISNYNFEKYNCVLPEVYFLSTYMDKEISKKIKTQINKNIQSIWERNNIKINNLVSQTNGKYNLAIITRFSDLYNNVVYKFIKYQIEKLYQLFNIDVYIIESNIGENMKHQINEALNIQIQDIYHLELPGDMSLFYKLETNYFANNNEIYNYIPNFEKIINNNYLACYFPVLGCEISTIYLSNLQIAPIQFSGYGHPISSFGSKNNYFIVSKEIEKLDCIEDNYSEKPIFIEGVTTIPIITDFTIDYNNPNKNNYILISSNFKKITPQFLETIRKIGRIYYSKYNQKLLLNIFPGHSRNFKNREVCCDRCIESNYYDHRFLGIPNYNEYMQTKYSCRVAFDSYPYGGFTTILENLKIHVPAIVYEGNEAVNNFPSYFYKKLDLTELIVYSYEEYIELAIKLLTDDDYYTGILKKIKNINFDSFFNNLTNEIQIEKSFTDLIQQYEYENTNK